MMDPFKPLSAKPISSEEETKLRRKQGASHGGKAHRGTRTKAPILFGNRGKPRKKKE